MKTQTDKTREQQRDTAPKVQQEQSTGGTAVITDNRPSTVYQRKLRETMNVHAAGKALTVQRKSPKGSSRFQQIATAMGEKHGVDTSGLNATHNSSFPAQLNAEATIQGNKIHFAPGKDTDYTIKHEVAHAIDNTLHGTPKGDQLVNGQKIDTTREKTVDRMAKEPMTQFKARKNVTMEKAESNTGESHLNQEHNLSTIQLHTVIPTAGMRNDRWAGAGSVLATKDEVFDWLRGQTNWNTISAQRWCLVGGSAYEHLLEYIIKQIQNTPRIWETIDRSVVNEVVDAAPTQGNEGPQNYLDFLKSVITSNDLDIGVDRSHSMEAFNEFGHLGGRNIEGKRIFCTDYPDPCVDLFPINGTTTIKQYDGVPVIDPDELIANTDTSRKKRKREARQDLIQLALQHNIL